MQSIATVARVRRPELKATPNFEVVLAYRDFSSGIRAKEFFDRLVSEHGRRFRFLCHLWKFDFLLAPGLSEQALAEAADADMVVIATHDQTELAPDVKDWIQFWLRQRRAPGALVALLDCAELPGGSTLPVCSYLREVAQKAQMEFFIHHFGPAALAFPFAANEPQQLERRIPLESGGQFQNSRVPSHWGINE